MMSVEPTLENSVKPALPAFYASGSDAEKFDAEGSFLLSKTSAPAEFSAEYNVTGAGASTYVFGYTDANNYLDVTVNDFSAEKLHTVRVAARGGKVDVSFDNMTKIDDAELTVPAGKIGYKSLAAGAEIG